jgi:hypothetical protein
MIILWRTEHLIGEDLETNNETTAVAMLWRDKHTSTTIELRLEMMFSNQFLQMDYKEDG